jgi:hypothetical protein
MKIKTWYFFINYIPNKKSVESIQNHGFEYASRCYHNLCDMKVMLGLFCLMTMFKGVKEFIKIPPSWKCFVCDFIYVIKLFDVYLYFWYNVFHIAYMDDILSGYWNLLSETSNVVVLEWGFNLIIGMDNVSFCIVGISIILFYHWFHTLFYVHVTWILFH